MMATCVRAFDDTDPCSAVLFPDYDHRETLCAKSHKSSCCCKATTLVMQTVDLGCTTVQQQASDVRIPLSSAHVLSSPSRSGCWTPLPKLQWADAQEVWSVMCMKDVVYHRDPALLRRHPNLNARMRATVLHWICEVCEFYRLHRETYHISVDFFDRYLATFVSPGLSSSLLQLVGVTALFIAAKLEEIYPPKVCDFAYATDGGCTEEQILHQEMLMLSGLKWRLSPLTAISWLKIYLQSASFSRSHCSVDQFETDAHYSTFIFLRAIQLIDLCLLDIDSLTFSYRALAAAALWYVYGSPRRVLQISDFSWSDLRPCISWMLDYSMILRSLPPLPLANDHLYDAYDIPCNIQHNYQTRGYDVHVLVRKIRL